MPETIRIEVKFTTSEAVPLPARELAALAVTDASEVGILATLFWCGDRGVDGRWLIADVNDAFRQTDAKTKSVSKVHMERFDRSQPWLSELKDHLARYWRPFLQAFRDEAMRGHDPLREELARCHEEGTFAVRPSDERILETDHRDAICGVIEQHGESVAGYVFQDLFAYLVGFAGYRTVTLNPVGVPDVTVTDLRSAVAGASEIDFGKVTLDEARRLHEYCQQAGDEVLAARIAELLRALDG